MTNFTLRSARQIIFGSGTRRQLGERAAAFGTRALLVCGMGAPQRGETIVELTDLLHDSGLTATLFAEVEAEPSIDTVERGREAFRTGNCDVVVALGGGSAMDVGKAVGALSRWSEPVSHFFAGGEIRFPGHPILALPTTSGTGAEVTPNSVLSDTATQCKASIRGHSLLPEMAIVDPELTFSLPPAQTAWSGVDALTQAIEAYTSTGASVFSDLLALEATTRIAASLKSAYLSGDDLAVRENMALGSLFAGLALASARLGLVHGLAHPLGALYHIPHGQVCGILLPHVMEFNLESCRQKYGLLAEAIGLGTKAEALLQWVRDLNCELGIIKSLADFGLQEDDFDRIIAPTLDSGSTKHNPRAVTAQHLRDLLAAMTQASDPTEHSARR